MDRALSRFGLNFGPVIRIFLVVAIGILGVVMAHYPMIFSRFQRIQGGLADTRLIHYLLEHGYRWVRREPTHLEFWNPPFFFPIKNVAAYSDVLLTVGPIYWLARALRASPDFAFGLWILSMSTLNYAAGLLLFRRGLGFGIPAAVAGALLVAFGSPRLNQMGHQQLLPFFFPLLTLYALARLFGNMSLGRQARLAYWLLAMAGIVAQLYAAVYPGWFLIVALALATVVALVMPSCRGALLQVISRDVLAIAASGAVGALLLQPFFAHYLQAAREVRTQYLPMLAVLQPTKSSWLNVGAENWFWGWAVRSGWFHQVTYLEGEHHLGIGLLTSVACVTGFSSAAIGRSAGWPRW